MRQRLSRVYKYEEERAPCSRYELTITHGPLEDILSYSPAATAVGMLTGRNREESAKKDKVMLISKYFNYSSIIRYYPIGV